MEEPFDPATARKMLQAILEGPGVTVFTKRAKADFMTNGMTSVDAVNVLRGGRIAPGTASASGFTYHAETRRMNVEFSFRRQHELVIERAWRNSR